MITFINAFFIFIIATLINWVGIELFSPLDINIGTMLAFSIIMAGILNEAGGYTFAFMSGLFLDFFSDVLFGGYALVFTLIMFIFYHIDDKIDFKDIGPQVVITAALNVLCVLLYGVCGLIFTGNFLWQGLKSFAAGSALTGLFMPFIYIFVTKYLIFNVLKKNNENKNLF